MLIEHLKFKERFMMNDQIQNINTTDAPTTFPFVVSDQDGNPVAVKAINPNEVQDIEYSDTPEGN